MSKEKSYPALSSSFKLSAPLTLTRWIADILMQLYGIRRIINPLAVVSGFGIASDKEEVN